MKLHGSPRKAIALVTTLALVVIVTILIVGFTASMRTERAASHAMARSGSAELLVRGAISHATSLLVENIPSPADPLVEPSTGAAQGWASNPGRLTLFGANGTQSIPLHSGAATSNSSLESFDLNSPLAVSGEHPISSGGEPMRVKWQPLLRDPSQPPGSGNALVGRYAFWIDDESTRVNFNTASGKHANVAADILTELSPRIERSIGSRTISYVLGHPASVNLDQFGQVLPQMYQDIYNKGFLATPDAIRNPGYVVSPEAFYRDSKFHLTAFSRAPEFNVFGKARIYTMDTPANLDYGGPFQLQSDNTQPVYTLTASQMFDKGNDREMILPLWRTLATYFTREDWPGYENLSFLKKWALEAPSTLPDTELAARAEVDQVTLNMLMWSNLANCYTGTAGDAKPDATHSIYTRVAYFNRQNNPDHTEPEKHFWQGPLSDEPMLPQTPLPMLNEAAIVVTPKLVAGKLDQYYLTYSLRSELYHQPMGVSYEGTEGIGTGNMAVRPSFLEYVATPTTGGTSIGQVFTALSNSNGQGWRTAPLNDLVGLPTGRLQPDSHMVVDSVAYYMGARVDGPPSARFDRPLRAGENVKAKFKDTVNLTFWLRTGTCVHTSYFSDHNGKPIQVTPMHAPYVDEESPLYRDKDSGGALKVEMTITLAPDGSSDGNQFIQSFEINDPQVYAQAEQWTKLPLNDDTMGGVNDVLPATQDTSKYRSWDLNAPNQNGLGFDDTKYQTSSRYPYRGLSIGMYSFLSTGLQRGLPWRSLSLKKAVVGEIPDWLLLDLLAPVVLQNRTSVDGTREVTPISYLSSTAGKINVNSRIYPEASEYFAPPERRKPLDALFAHMPNGAAAVEGILEYQESGAPFRYVGEISQADGVAESGQNDFEKEALVRHLSSTITTQSNTFGIWGVVQSVKERRGSVNGQFEQGDQVTAQRRFYAVVERAVWKGRDHMPGNGHVDAATGAYDRLANGKSMPQEAPGFGGQYAMIDGPDAPQLPTAAWGSYPANPDPAAPLESADNPLRALMKYNVIYFEYLND